MEVIAMNIHFSCIYSLFDLYCLAEIVIIIPDALSSKLIETG